MWGKKKKGFFVGSIKGAKIRKSEFWESLSGPFRFTEDLSLD